jgi:DNA-binding YbaB/EbfC family protein
MGIFDSLKQLSQLKQQALEFQKILASKEVEVGSKNKEIKIKMNGKMELLSIEIDENILKPENKNYIEKLIKKTFEEAQKEIEKIIAKEIKSTIGFPFF